MRLVRICCLLVAATSSASFAHAQRADLGVSFTASRSLKAASGENFWMNGGSIELGLNAWKGWGVAASVTGTHSSSIGSSGIPISLVTTVFGPRYRWHEGRKCSFYGEGLVGEANGFGSLFPANGNAQTSANGFASQVGGGIDISLGKRFAWRALEASWQRTQLPNATDNVQNNLQLGSGFVVRFGR